MTNQINMNELYNSRIIDTYIKFLRKEYKFTENNINDLLTHADMRREEVSNPTKWFSQNQINNFMEYLGKLTGKNINDIAHQAGLYAATPEASGLMRRIFIGFMGPERAYSVIGKYTEKYYSRSAKYESEKINNKYYRVTVTPYEGITERPFQCHNRRGYFEAISELLNKKAKILEHKECCCPEKGPRAKSCVYEITWDESAIEIDEAKTKEQYKNRIKELERIIEEQRESAEGLLEQIHLNFETANLIRDIGAKIDIASTEDIDNALEGIPRLIVERLKYSRCAIFLSDKERSRLICRISFGFSPEHIKMIHRFLVSLQKEEESFFSRVFIHEEPQVVNNMDEIRQSISNRESQFFNGIETRKFAVCPISHKANVVGILFADNPQTERNLDQSDINLLMAVVPQIGSVIDKYFEKIEEIRARLEKRSRGIPVPSRYKVSGADIRQTPIDSLVTFFNVLKTSLGIDPDISNHLEKEVEKLSEIEKNQIRKEMVRRALHSIQNPAWNLLNSIKWMKMEVSSKDLTDELNQMVENVERIRGIANDFSRYIKPLSERRESLDLLGIINKVILRNLSKYRNIQKEFSETPIIVKGDKAEIEWVIEELIQNAFKYGASELYIKADIDRGSATVVFKDNGHGIKDENIEDLFVPFRIASGHGTGLGLANIKRIMEAHGGNIFYNGQNDKNREKPGAVFVIEMPVEKGGSDG